MKRFLYLGVAIFLIVFESIPEGLALNKNIEHAKMIAGIIEFVKLAAITLVVFAYFTAQYPRKENYTPYGNAGRWYNPDYWWFIAGYVLLRMAIFAIIFNLAAGVDPFFLGTTKLYDIVMIKLGTWGWFMSFVGGIAGIAFLMQWRHGIRFK